MPIFVLTKAAIVSRLLLRLQSFVPVAKNRGGEIEGDGSCPTHIQNR